MKRKIIILSFLTINLLAMPAINKDSKYTRGQEASGSLSINKSENYGLNESKNRTVSQDKSYALSHSKGWSKTISKTKDYTLTKNGLLAANLDIFPIIYEVIAKKYRNDPHVQYTQNLNLNSLGFDDMGNDLYTDNMQINYYNSVASRNGKISDYNNNAEKQMKKVFINIYEMADIISYIAKELRQDEKLNAYNLHEKIIQHIPYAVEKMKENRDYGDYEIAGSCRFSSNRSYSCDNGRLTLEVDNAGHPTLQKGQKIIFGKGVINGRSLSLNVTLGHSLSEGLQLAEADRKSRDAVRSAKKALSMVKTKGKTKQTTRALTRALNKVVKENGDMTINKTLSTNPIK